MSNILKLLSRQQVFELVNSLQVRGELPLKFNYIGEGAKNWIRFEEFSAKKNGIIHLQRKLLEEKINIFISYLKNFKKLNIVDLGCGSGKSILPILNYCVRKNIKISYTIIDISQKMAEIAEKNIASKFGEKIKIKKDIILKIQEYSIPLYKNMKILLARSIKFSDWNFIKLISEIDLRPKIITTKEDKRYIFALVQPTRYN